MGFDLERGQVGPPIGTTFVRPVDVPDMNYLNGKVHEFEDPKIQEIFSSGKNKHGHSISS